MADSQSSSLQSTPSLLDLLATLDPYTPITTTPTKPITIPRSNSTGVAFAPSDFTFERGPRYDLYSKLRDSRIRSRTIPREQESLIPRFIPPSSSSPARKSIDFSSSVTPRKENRRPPVMENNVVLMSPAKCFTTPPRDLPKPSRVLGNGAKLVGGGGSKSMGVMGRKSCASFGELMGFSDAVVARETRGGGAGGSGGGSQSVGVLGEKRGMAMGRKSYANLEDLRGLSAAAANAIAGETRSGCAGGGGGMSHSVGVGGEKKGMMQTRKSYASMDELKGVSSAAAGESRGGKIGNMIERLKAAATGGKRSGGGSGVVEWKSYASIEEIKGLAAAEGGAGGGFGVPRGARTPGRDVGFGYRHW
ncbi:hypothetical protein Droror1_Dr00016097 [Drosera rotundifolia]